MSKEHARCPSECSCCLWLRRFLVSRSNRPKGKDFPVPLRQAPTLLFSSWPASWLAWLPVQSLQAPTLNLPPLKRVPEQFLRPLPARSPFLGNRSEPLPPSLFPVSAVPSQLVLLIRPYKQ